MIRPTVIAFLSLAPLAVVAFSSLHTPSKLSLHPTSQSMSSSSSQLFVSTGFDFEGDSASSELLSTDEVSKPEHKERLGPRQRASRITQAVLSTVPAIHRRIWSVPRGLLIAISEHQAAAKFHAETAKIEKQSQNWILRTVVGLSLCPFSLPSIKKNQVKFIVVRGTDANEIGQAVVQELLAQKESPSGENSIVVTPDYYPGDFYAYMRMIQYLEEAPMNQFDLHESVQIAPFHPHFVFDFNEIEDEENKSSPIIDNYANRSPYPMIHILKQNDVDHAVATSCGGDPGKVTRRNAKLLRKFETVLGKQGAIDFLFSFATQDEMSEYPEDMVNQVMKEFRHDGDDGPVEGMARGVWRI